MGDGLRKLDICSYLLAPLIANASDNLPYRFMLISLGNDADHERNIPQINRYNIAVLYCFDDSPAALQLGLYKG